MLVLAESRYVDIKPVMLGGNGRLKALALLGDRLLDIVLYQDMLVEGMVHEGRMSQRRGMCVANSTLATAGEKLLTPHVLPVKKYSSLSAHEKGTMVEAYLGALLEQNNFNITSEVFEAVREVLVLLNECVSSKMVDAHASQYKANPTIKKCKPQLLEIFQRRGIDNAASFFSCVSVGPKPNLPPFVVTFKAPYNLTYCGLPDTGVVTSDECSTKKEAEEQASRRVLDIFLSNEKRVFGELVQESDEPAKKRQKTSNDSIASSEGTSENCVDSTNDSVTKAANIVVEDALYDIQILQDNGEFEFADSCGEESICSDSKSTSPSIACAGDDVALEEGEIADDPEKRLQEENIRIREKMLAHIARNKVRVEMQRKRYQEYLAKKRRTVPTSR